MPDIVRFHPVIRVDVDDIIAGSGRESGHSRTRQTGVGLMEYLYAGLKMRELLGEDPFKH